MRNMIYLFFFLNANLLFGQVDTVYLKADHDIANDRNAAVYIRVLKSKNDDGTTNVVDYLLGGAKVFEGSVVYLNSDLQVHKYFFYNDDGTIKYEGEIDNITERDYKGFKERTYYNNGQLRATHSFINREEKFIEAYDSLGKSTILNGNGKASFALYYYHRVWYGNVKEFKRDSIWTAIDTRTNKVIHLELYKSGKFLNGKTFQGDDVIEYDRYSIPIENKSVNKLKKLIKNEINSQISKKQRLRSYKVGVVFTDGKAKYAIHLVKDLAEKKIDFTNLTIPENITLFDKGVPIEKIVLSLEIR